MHDIEEIYKEYFKIVYKYLLCLTHDSDTSEELTQETFYRAVKSINRFKGDCKLSVWLCQIAKNLWYDEFKKRNKFKNIENVDLINFTTADNLEDYIISTDNKMELYRRMQKLDKQTREVIYLRITGELSFKEIGIILNKTENWARVTFYRGKQKLSKEDII